MREPSRHTPASFLARLTGGAGAREAELVPSLERLLNTREGHGSFLPGFGLGRYYGLLGTEAIEALAEEIRQTVTLYEPRLHEPRVKVLDRDAELNVHLQLEGLVQREPRTFHLSLHASLGNVRVRKVSP